MQEIDKIIRAWKDEDYRLSLSADELQALPANPAGGVQLLHSDLNPTTPYFTLLIIELFICDHR